MERRNGETLRLKRAVVGQRIVCHGQVQHMQGGMQWNSKAASLTTVLAACLFLLPCLLRLRNQRFSFMLGMLRFVRVMRVL